MKPATTVDRARCPNAGTWALLGLALAASASAEAGEALAGKLMAIGPPQALPIQVIPQDVEVTRVEDPVDGSVVVGGHLGVALPCTPGPQAFVRKEAADGTTDWLLTANADEDCDDDGVPDGGGSALFDNWPFFDPAHIDASTVQEIVEHSNGDYYATGHILVSWVSADGLQAVWGAFVLRMKRYLGGVVAQAYFGALPTGPPADVEACESLCLALSDSTLDQYGSRAIDVRGGAVAVAGYKRTATETEVGDKDVFVAKLSEDLTVVDWVSARSFPGDDEALDVSFDDQGDVLAAGYFSTAHDAFAARFHGVDGEVLNVFTVKGPLHDEAYLIQPETDDESGLAVVRLLGFFIDWAFFGPNHLEQGSGTTNFTATLSEDLKLLGLETSGQQNGSSSVESTERIQVIGGGGGAGGGSGGGGTGGGGGGEGPAVNHPDDVEILVGQNGSCEDEGVGDECVGKVSSSDNDYLEVDGVWLAEDVSQIEFQLRIPISADQPRLKSLSLEVSSDYCSSFQVFLGGGELDPGEYYPVAAADVCPYDEPIFTMDVTEELAGDLGFLTSLPPVPLLVYTMLEMRGLPCPVGGCSSSAASSSVDEAQASSDYP